MPSIYVPQSAAIGCDVALFEAYFGYKAKGTEEPGAGAFPQGPDWDVGLVYDAPIGM